MTPEWVRLRPDTIKGIRRAKVEGGCEEAGRRSKRKASGKGKYGRSKEIERR